MFNINENDYDFIKIEEKIYQVLDGSISFYVTNFLSLAYQYRINNLCKKLHLNIKYLNKGERKVAVIYMFDLDAKEINNIKVLKINCYEKIKHNEIMGAILNLGIKREVIGNILVENDLYLVEVIDKMEDFIKDNLTYISHNKVSVENSNLEIGEPKTTSKNVIVSSMRLDNVVSSIFNVSRELAKELIDNKEVYLNFNNILKADQKVNVESYLSCHHKGKVFIDSIKGNTKKENIILVVNYY